MARVVKRTYQSELRASRARDTRRRIIDSAAALFASEGYGSVSIDSIAEAAGVSRKTVFTAVGGKAEILALALDWAVAGDDEALPVADRPEMVAVLAHAEPGEILDGWAQVLTDIDARVGDLFAVLEAAAGLDESARALFDTVHDQRRAGARRVVDAVAERGGLRDDLRRSDAVDLACLFTEPLLHRRLVGVRGWSNARFRTWLAQTLRQQLL